MGARRQARRLRRRFWRDGQALVPRDVEELVGLVEVVMVPAQGRVKVLERSVALRAQPPGPLSHRRTRKVGLA